MADEEVVIDTNVLVGANNRPGDGVAVNCALECVQYLREVQANSRIHIDSLGLIVGEYRTYCNYAGQPGAGDRFFLWLHRNQANPLRVRTETITPHEARGFAEFPEAPTLAAFDPSDREFVAASLASADSPVIAHSADQGWLHHQAALAAAGVATSALCLSTRVIP